MMDNQEKKTSNILIIYYSKTGFTKKYAEWIRESVPENIGCDLVPYEERKSIQFGKYDTILFGGGFHARQINGLKWFKAQMSKQAQSAGKQDRRVGVFATGAMPADAPDVEKAMRQNFTEKEWTDIKTFYLQGGLCYEKMGTGDKLMMAVFRTILKKTNADSQMQQAVSHSYDLTSKGAVAPLVEWCITSFSRSM